MKDRACTAWVGANDDAAVLELTCLRSRGKRIPGDISIFGFDNEPIGFENRITAFVFDFPDIASQLMLFITHPLWGTRFTKKSFVEMPGSIIKRAATEPRPHNQISNIYFVKDRPKTVVKGFTVPFRANR